MREEVARRERERERVRAAGEREGVMSAIMSVAVISSIDLLSVKYDTCL